MPAAHADLVVTLYCALMRDGRVSDDWFQRQLKLVDRTDGDLDTLSARIRDAEVHKVPYMAVIGEREAEAGTAAIRRRGGGRKQEVMDREAFIAQVVREIRSRSKDGEE